MKNIKAVILDWAGTSVDFGCMGPAKVFIEVFKRWNIEITPEQARMPMGLAKKDHTRTLLQMPEIANQWVDLYGRMPKEKDVEDIFSKLTPAMSDIIKEFATPIPGTLKFMDFMHQCNIKVGSTTGYMPEIMDLLIPEAARHGFVPDSVVNPNDVSAGRPAPYMCYLNAMKLGVYPFNRMIKIGDTVADIQEGLNAGMWTIGVTKSGNEVGLSWDEMNESDPFVLDVIVKKAALKLRNAGAHYVADGIWDCLNILEEINLKIEQGQLPGTDIKLKHSYSI